MVYHDQHDPELNNQEIEDAGLILKVFGIATLVGLVIIFWMLG